MKTNNTTFRYSKRTMRKAILFCIKNENSSVFVILCDTIYPLMDAVRIIVKQKNPSIPFSLHYSGGDGEISFNNGSRIRFYEKQEDYNESVNRKED